MGLGWGIGERVGGVGLWRNEVEGFRFRMGVGFNRSKSFLSKKYI